MQLSTQTWESVGVGVQSSSPSGGGGSIEPEEVHREWLGTAGLSVSGLLSGKEGLVKSRLLSDCLGAYCLAK